MQSGYQSSRTGRQALAKIRMAMNPQTRIDLPPIRRWSDDAYDVLADGASSAAS
jgi:hypothetical protein